MEGMIDKLVPIKPEEAGVEYFAARLGVEPRVS